MMSLLRTAATTLDSCATPYPSELLSENGNMHAYAG